MKTCVVLVLAAVFQHAAHAQPPRERGGDLRRAVQQYHPAGAPAPRQLTPVERAELRRQLSELGRGTRRSR
jgi:hypothetical protein